MSDTPPTTAGRWEAMKLLSDTPTVHAKSLRVLAAGVFTARIVQETLRCAAHHLEELERENQELRKQVEELQRDKARLDAIAAHFWEVAGNRFGQWVVLFPNPDGSELIAKANSIRQAIDAAMQAHQTQTGTAPIVPDRLTQAEATLAQHEKEIARFRTLI